MTEYHITFRVTVTLISNLVLIIIVPGAYLILFEIGIPNLVCECILGWWSVLYQLWVIVTLTSNLVFYKKHISHVIKGRNPKFSVWMQLLMSECHILFLGHFDPDL